MYALVIATIIGVVVWRLSMQKVGLWACMHHRYVLLSTKNNIDMSACLLQVFRARGSAGGAASSATRRCSRHQ